MAKMERPHIEKVLLEEIANSKMRQKDVAVTYSFAIPLGENINWRRINQAIIARWSMAALKRIKNRAWKAGQ